MLTASCGVTGKGTKYTPVVIDTGCEWVKPIYVSKDDVFTANTASQLLIHNETWKTNCTQ